VKILDKKSGDLQAERATRYSSRSKMLRETRNNT